METDTIVHARARKIGGSLVVTLPREVVKEENINENDELALIVKKRRKSYFGALKGIGSYNREEDRTKDRI